MCVPSHFIRTQRVQRQRSIELDVGVCRPLSRGTYNQTNQMFGECKKFVTILLLREENWFELRRLIVVKCNQLLWAERGIFRLSFTKQDDKIIKKFRPSRGRIKRVKERRHRNKMAAVGSMKRTINTEKQVISDRFEFWANTFGGSVREIERESLCDLPPPNVDAKNLNKYVRSVC